MLVNAKMVIVVITAFVLLKALGLESDAEISKLIGNKTVRIFKYEKEPVETNDFSNISL